MSSTAQLLVKLRRLNLIGLCVQGRGKSEGDLRLLVRERILAGDDNDEVVQYIVQRYGEFVLLQPTAGGWNWLLWATGPLGLLFALIVAALYLRGRSTAPAKEGLSEAEQSRLDEILKN